MQDFIIMPSDQLDMEIQEPSNGEISKCPDRALENPDKVARFAPVAYQFNPETGYYTKSAHQHASMPCDAMPYEVRREHTRANQVKCNADEVLTVKEIKKSNGGKRILTGLQTVGFYNWYIGNRCVFTAGKKKISDILFYFSPDHAVMMAFYFAGYHSNGKYLRERFAARVIPYLKSTFNL